MTHIITGTVTFSNQSTRNAALTRVNDAVSGFTYENVATVFSAGINTPNTTTITFSLQSEEAPGTIFDAIMTALVSGTRHTSGYVSMNKI